MEPDIQEMFDRVMAKLDKANAPHTSAHVPDAIDEVLGHPARTTAVVSLRDGDAMQAFRHELTNDLIRADSVRAFMGILNTVLSKVIG